MPKEIRSNKEAWGVYWRSGVLTTLGDKATYKGDLREFWVCFFEKVERDKTVVDLGAGNGAIEEIAQEVCNRQRKSVTIHAVDAAPLSPGAKSTLGDFCQIIWHPVTQNEATHLPESSVDAVTGNYAFEYGDDAATVEEISRILKVQGRGRFLMHHSDSILILESAEELVVLDAALARYGLFDIVKVFLHEFGNIRTPSQYGKLRTSGEARPILKKMDEAHHQIAMLTKTPVAREVLDSLTRGILSLITPPHLYEPKQLLLGYLAAARSDYIANRNRLKSMQKAKVDDDRMQRILNLFETQNIHADAKAFYVSEVAGPIGWAVNIEKNCGCSD